MSDAVSGQNFDNAPAFAKMYNNGLGYDKV